MFGFDPLNPIGSVQQPGQFVDIPPAKHGMFGGGKIKIDLGRAIAGYLAGSGNPAGAQMLQAMDAMRQRQMDHQQSLDDYNRSRADNNADFQAHRQYEISNPLPQQPDELESALMASGVKPGTPEWAQAMTTRRDNILDPIVMTLQGPMTRSQALKMSGGQPAPPGVTFTTIEPGGQTPPASGGFPGY